jgi:hypothetical protein
MQLLDVCIWFLLEATVDDVLPHEGCTQTTNMLQAWTQPATMLSTAKEIGAGVAKLLVQAQLPRQPSKTTSEARRSKRSKQNELCTMHYTASAFLPSCQPHDHFSVL